MTPRRSGATTNRARAYRGSRRRRNVDQLRSKWQENGFPIDALAHAMIVAGITDLANERGVEAALRVLRELA